MLADSLLKRLPEPNLDELASVFYLSLVMRLSNDPVADCRAASSTAIKTLLKRVSAGVFHQLLDFTGNWFGDVTEGEGDPATPRKVGEEGREAVALRRSAAQTSGFFFQSRPELVRKARGERRWPWLLSALRSLLPKRASEVIARARSAGWAESTSSSIPGFPAPGDAAVDDWVCVYQAVLALGKAFDAHPAAFNAALSENSSRHDGGGGSDGEAGDGRPGLGAAPLPDGLLDRLLEALLYPHAWVRLATARFWAAFFSRRDAGNLMLSESQGSRGDRGEASTGPGGGGGSREQRGRSVGVPTKAGLRAGSGDGDGGEEFLRRRRVLFRLCQNVCAQLNRAEVGVRCIRVEGSACCCSRCFSSSLSLPGLVHVSENVSAEARSGDGSWVEPRCGNPLCLTSSEVARWGPGRGLLIDGRFSWHHAVLHARRCGGGKH